MAFDTRSGNKRYVLRDGEGKEYTTSASRSGRGEGLEGSRLGSSSTSQRGQYTNVYLDKVEPAPDAPARPAARGQRAPTRTRPPTPSRRGGALAAGELSRNEEVPPEELYEKLRPFKELWPRTSEGRKRSRSGPTGPPPAAPGSLEIPLGADRRL